MKVYAAPDDTALGRKIRNALEAIAVDEDSGLTALVEPGPFAVRYITLVYLRECQSAGTLGAQGALERAKALERSEAYGRECQSAVASGARALALSSASALSRALALSISALRRAGLEVDTRDGVVLTVKHDLCHSQIYRERPSAREAE